MEAGPREIAGETGRPLIVYLKSEDEFGSDNAQGEQQCLQMRCSLAGSLC